MADDYKYRETKEQLEALEAKTDKTDDDYKKIEQLKTTIANYESNTDSNNISKETSEENQPTGEDSPENQNADETTEDEEKLDVPESDPASENSGNNQKPPIAPWDVRLYRSDLFVKGDDRIPLSSDEVAPVLADMIDYNPGKNAHALPADQKQYGILANDPNLYGSLSLINPYSITRIYNSLKRISFDNNKFIIVGENRMLDIRDKKRFYDTKVTDLQDILSVSNPTTTNIIQLMNNDKWGRTPYTYQDFAFCKYFGRVPNNRLITLRKYAAPTYDNLCWEMMGEDKRTMNKSFAPIATACTYFGEETGNSLKDLFQIESGLNWGELEATIWKVSGDTGESETQVADRILDQTNGTNTINTTKSVAMNSMFNFFGKKLSNTGSLLKFLGATRNPDVFDADAYNTEKFYQNLHDPNDGGPFANRIQGPLNRIDKVMRRKEGIKFDHKISLKFSYVARPIGGVNTKTVMMEIISNMLMLCSASAVFWGGGHKFMIQPHAYPWNNLDQHTRGFLKSVYNGNFFGQKGAIAQALQGIVSVGVGGGGAGGFNFDNVLRAMKNIGAGVMGALGGALNTLVGALSGSLGDVSEYMAKGAEYLNSKFKDSPGFATGASAFSNIMKNTQSIWRANSIKQTVLPSVEGMRALLLGVPVGNWHLTIGNPLNPIAVIGNLICQDIKFNFGEELGPDDFPTEIEFTVTLEHGMPRDLAAIESMFNRGAGRIYQAPDYIKMWGQIPASEEETKVDALTGGTATRVPHAFMAVEGAAKGGKYFSRNIANSSRPSNAGKSSSNIDTPINGQSIVDFYRDGDNIDLTGTPIKYSRKSVVGVRSKIMGNLATRHYADS